MNTGPDILAKVVLLWAPPPRVALSEWADRYRRTSPEASAEVGLWRTRPYQREPMDAFTDAKVRAIIIMSAVQMLKTEFILNALGYVIHLNPGPVLIIQFRDTDCETFSKIRLAPMLRDTPVLRNRVSDSKSRASGNTITHKTFPGGHLRIAASASPGNLAALPIRFLFCDEVDKYPVSAGPEGDPITLAEGRMVEFEGISKEIQTCSPTVAGKSRIEKSFEESDKREYEVPCPECGAFQILKWAQVQFDPPRYICEHCKAQWDDVTRWKAINQGRFRATAPFNGVAGFRLSGLCSLKKRLSQYVSQFQKAVKDPERLKAFVNTVLAETWIEQGDAPEWKRLYDRRELYKAGTVPVGVLFLTAGADVQKDRIEVSVYGWGRGKESWLIDHVVLDGDTSAAPVWAKLTAFLNMTYPHPCGLEMPIVRLAVDSGYATQTVYAWARQHAGTGRVMVVKGVDHATALVGQPTAVDVTIEGRKIQRGMKVWPVASSMLKSELYGWLKLEAPTMESGDKYPAGYCHFPEMGEEFFRQLTAEQLVTKPDRRGFGKSEWTKLRDRNEALDCRNYARAAAAIHGLDRFREEHWSAMEKLVQITAEVPATRSPALRPRMQIRLG